MPKKKGYVRRRLAEPSTHAGMASLATIGTLLSAFGVPATVAQAVPVLIGLGSSLYAMFKPDTTE
jgi:hypothetical protein